jgi:hypothetical protein
MGQIVDSKGTGVAGAMVLLDGGLQAIGSSIQAAPLSGDPRRTATSADGHFVFFDLPGGVYSVEAAKPGFLPGAYGRKRYAGGAQSIRLGDGERLTSIRFQMWEYAAVGGRIQDEAGEPLVGVKVRALRRVLEAGRWRLDATVNAALADDTDDRGEYRIDGLPPGDYVVVVPSTQTTMPGVYPAPPPSPFQTPASVAATAQAGGQALLRTVDDWMLLTPRRGAPTIPPPALAGELFVYPTVFYPGAPSATDASVVALRSGEERLGVNLQVAPVRTSTVSGTVTWPGAVVPGQSVRLLPEYIGDLTTDGGFEVALATADPAGRFMFLGVPPGQYLLRATTSVTGGEAGRRMLSAAMPLTVGPTGVSNVALTMRGGVRVSGRVAFDGARPKPGPDALQRFGIRLDPADPFAHRSQTAYTAAVDAAGNFQIIDVPPGKYIVKFQASAQDRRAMEGWESVGAVLGGRDVSTRPMDVQSDTSGIILTLSDHAGRLSGIARDASGRVDPDACVLLFTTERDLWMDIGLTNRRIRAVRAGEDGTFVIPVVHDGTYFLAAIPETDAANWDDPRVMERIALRATRVVFGENERKTLDVTTQPIR